MDPLTLSDLITEVTTFTAAYEIYVAAGAVLGLAFWGIRKLIKAGR